MYAHMCVYMCVCVDVCIYMHMYVTHTHQVASVMSDPLKPHGL